MLALLVPALVKLPPEKAARVVYGPEQVSRLVSVDYKIVNPNMPEWTKRWNREIER